jgi:hypothetical protein
MNDRVTEKKIAGDFHAWTLKEQTPDEEAIIRADDYDFSYVTYRAGYLAAIEPFSEPAPAEQGEGLNEKWLAQWFASKKRAFNVQMGLAPLPRLGDPIPPSHCLADYMGREIKALVESLASRPQPEAKVVPMAMLRELVNQGYRQLGDKTIKQIVYKHMPGYTVKE